MDFRSKSCRDGRMRQTEISQSSTQGNKASQNPTSMQDLRCSSVNCAHPSQSRVGGELKIKRSEGRAKISTPETPPIPKSWSLKDPELQRKKRVAGYKVYGLEGKMKESLRKSFRWIKNTYTQVVYGSW